MTGLFILFTTCNSPDIFLPAYQDQRSSFIFFFLFLLVSLYLLRDLFLATVFESYKAQLVIMIKRFYRNRGEAVQYAFQLMADENGLIQKSTWTAFFLEQHDL